MRECVNVFLLLMTENSGYDSHAALGGHMQIGKIVEIGNWCTLRSVPNVNNEVRFPIELRKY